MKYIKYRVLWEGDEKFPENLFSSFQKDRKTSCLFNRHPLSQFFLLCSQKILLRRRKKSSFHYVNNVRTFEHSLSSSTIKDATNKRNNHFSSSSVYNSHHLTTVFFLLLLTSHRISLPKEKEEKRKCLSIFCETLPRNEIIIEARFQFRYSYVT